MTTDPVTLLRLTDPAQNIGAYEPAAATVLLDRAMTARDTKFHRRGWPSIAVGTGLAALVGGAGAAYAVFAQSAETALQIECAVGVDRSDFERFASGGSIMTTASGDPVGDCAGEYQRLEGEVPELRAYAHGQTYITVVPIDWTVPADWQPLGQEFRSDPARVELESRLADQIEGPEARCLDLREAELLVRREMADLGLTGWAVERLSQADLADGMNWCAVAFVEGQGRAKVLIQGLEYEPIIPGSADNIVTVTDELRRDIVEQCLTLPRAIEAAENAVRSAGFDPSEAKITAIDDPAAPCTRVDFVPAGLISIVLRGPAG